MAENIMEPISEPGPSHIHVVEIPLQPFQIKEEKVFEDDVNSPPDDEQEGNQPEHEQELEDPPTVAVEKKRSGRTRFSIYQKAELEGAFTASPYLSTQRRLALAARLRVKPSAIQSWFKNRRFKWRKDAREGNEQNTQALPVPPGCLPFMYPPPYVYGSPGPVPVPPPSPQCQGCYKGQPSGESCVYAADFSVHPYYPC